MPVTDYVTGKLPANNTVVDIGCAGFAHCGIRLSGTFSGTVTFQGSVDGAAFDTLTVLLFDGTTAVTTATAAGQWTVSCAGLTTVRCAMTSYSSGTALVFMRTQADG